MATQKDFKCIMTHLKRMSDAHAQAMKYIARLKPEVVGRSKAKAKSKVANDTKTTRTRKKAVA